MRQQEANQFDKGINLDTNPIAMDNHQLTGALNATMITMNGNELVLQNDMGNGRVDQAQLPEGYVPVGMQEYGGIVYVASYNPLIGKSQIGCFPSPQRNFPSEENGTGAEPLPSLSSFIVNESTDSNPDYFISNLSQKKLLIGSNDIVRTGDKFVITSNQDAKDYEDWHNYIKLKATVVNDDGSSIDITNELVKPSGNTYNNENGDGTNVSALGDNKTLNHIPFIKIISDSTDISNNDYSIYQNKISGKIYLETSLIVPSYINTIIQASKNNDAVTITIIPTSYDISDGETEVLWSSSHPHNEHSYALNYKINGEYPQNVTLPLTPTNNQFEITGLSENDTLWYELYPTYQYQRDDNGNFTGPIGKVKSLKRENTIEISDIGTGEVKFSTFRYYNNMANETFSFDYGLNAYIEGFDDGNNHTLNSVYIEAYNVDDILNDNGTAKTYDNCSSAKKIIQLGTSNYFGVYTKMISYGAETFEIGKHYIARLCSIVDKTNDNDGILTKGNWYSVITSTVTNKLYVQNTDNMIKIQTDDYPDGSSFNRHVFEFEWSTEFNRELIDENSSEQVTSDSASSGVLTTAPSSIDQRIQYKTKKSGDATYKHTSVTKISQSRSVNDASGGRIKFPYDMSVTPTISFSDFKANAEIIRNGELSDSTVSGFSDETFTDSQPSGTDINKIWYTKTENNIKLNYNLWSQFFQKLLKNPNSGGNTVEDYKFTLDTQMSAFVPYLPAHRVGNYSEDQLTSILGPLSVANVESNPSEGCSPIYTDIQQQHWLYYELDTPTYKDSDSKNYSDKYISIVHDSYAHREGGETVVFAEDYTEKDAYPRWNQLSPKIVNTIKKTCGFAPALLMWAGCDNWTCTLFPMSGPTGGDTNYRQAWYGIIMMLDETGNYHVLNQYGKNLQGRFMLDIVKSFAHIYVCQPDQQVEFDYWTGDTNNYVYTKNYQLNTTYKISASVPVNTTPTISNVKYNHYNTGESNISFDTPNNVFIQLPKIQLVSGKVEQQYSDKFSSPDQSVKISQFLSDTGAPTFDTCAIILDKAGRHIVMNAYRHHSNNEYTPVAFNPNHVYITNECNNFDIDIGSNTKLFDIQDAQNILPPVWISSSHWTSGSGWIAQAIRDGKIKVINNPENNNKILVVVPSRCNKLNNNNGWWLGNSFRPDNTDNWRSARRKLSDLCGGFLDVNLFTGNTHDGSDNRIRKLSDSWNVTVFDSNLQPS